jgi:hypothetical protein
MRLLFVADGRSPIALNWIEYFVQTGHEVHLISTYPCTSPLPLASLRIIPVAFGDVAGSQKNNALTIPPSPPILSQNWERMGGKEDREGTFSLLRALIPVGLRTAIKQRFGPRTLPVAARQLQQAISEIKPDLVHAMRIPYEGMLAAMAEPPCPLLVSVWGNDFTLHAPSTPGMRDLSRLTLQRAAIDGWQPRGAFHRRNRL